MNFACNFETVKSLANSYFNMKRASDGESESSAKQPKAQCDEGNDKVTQLYEALQQLQKLVEHMSSDERTTALASYMDTQIEVSALMKTTVDTFREQLLEVRGSLLDFNTGQRDKARQLLVECINSVENVSATTDGFKNSAIGHDDPHDNYQRLAIFREQLAAIRESLLRLCIDERPNALREIRDTMKEIDKLVDLPLQPELLQKILSMLNDDDESFWERVNSASVSRQLRVAVLGSIQAMKRRRMTIEMEDTYISISGVDVNDELHSGYSQLECIDALLAFGQPTELYITNTNDPNLKLVEECLVVAERILASTLLCCNITRLHLQVRISEFGVATPFGALLTCIGRMTDLEELHIFCFVESNEQVRAHKAASPLLPDDSPFLELLKLERLRVLLVTGSILTAAQQGELMNRSSSILTHICAEKLDFRVPLHELLGQLNVNVRARITDVCCLHDIALHMNEELPALVDCLPRCARFSINRFRCSVPNRREFDAVGEQLLERAIANRTNIQVTVGYGETELQAVSEEDGQNFKTELEYERNSTSVHLSLVSERSVIFRRCVLGYERHHHL